MKALRVGLSGIWNSFRLPLTHMYQRSLLFPPPSTLFGLLGSAMGLGIIDTHIGLPNDGIRVGLVGQPENRLRLSKDLMTFHQFEGRKVTKQPVNREIVGQLRCCLFVTAAANILENIYDAFLSPKGPLCLGHADEMVSAEIPEFVELKPPDRESVWYPGLYQGDIRKLLRFDVGARQIWRAPFTFSLPIGFEYLDDYGLRRVPENLYSVFTQLSESWPCNFDDIRETTDIWSCANGNFMVQMAGLDCRDSR